MSETLRTSIYCPKLECTADVEITYELVATPNGKPDRRDPWSEGYDIQPEILSIMVIDFEDELPVEDWVDDHIKNFEEIYHRELQEILEEYLLEEENEDYYYDEEGM